MVVNDVVLQNAEYLLDLTQSTIPSHTCYFTADKVMITAFYKILFFIFLTLGYVGCQAAKPPGPRRPARYLHRVT